MPTHHATGNPDHQNTDQEITFQDVLRKLCADDAAGVKFRMDVLNNDELNRYDLSPDQKVAFVKVGHAAGKYGFHPNYPGFCCCCA